MGLQIALVFYCFGVCALKDASQAEAAEVGAATKAHVFFLFLRTSFVTLSLQFNTSMWRAQVLDFDDRLAFFGPLQVHVPSCGDESEVGCFMLSLGPKFWFISCVLTLVCWVNSVICFSGCQLMFFFYIVFSFGSTSDGCFFHIGTCYLAGISSSTLPGYDAVVDYAALLSANSEGWKKDRISDDFEANSNSLPEASCASQKWQIKQLSLHGGGDCRAPQVVDGRS